MNNDLAWAGGVAGSLIAVGTVLRWTVRRIFRFTTWVTAAVRLPSEVERLAHSVTDLSHAVHTLTVTLHSTEET